MIRVGDEPDRQKNTALAKPPKYTIFRNMVSKIPNPASSRHKATVLPTPSLCSLSVLNLFLQTDDLPSVFKLKLRFLY